MASLYQYTFMKKIFIVAAIVCMAISSVDAQEFYLKAGLGYGFAQTGQTMDGTGAVYSGSITNNNNGTETYSMKNASLGTGLKGVIGLGYMFNKYVGVELNAAIGIANKKYTFTDNNYITTDSVTGVLSYTNQATTTVFLMPSLIVQNGGDKWNIYARFGVVLPVYAQSTQHQIFANYPGAGAVETDDYEWRQKYNFSLGFTGAAGVSYKLNDNLSLFAEVNMISLSLYLKESDLKNIDVDGQSYPLSQLPASFPQKVTYSKKVTVDPNDQSQEPTFAVPYSNVGFTVGVKLALAHHNGSKHHDALRERSARFN